MGKGKKWEKEGRSSHQFKGRQERQETAQKLENRKAARRSRDVPVQDADSDGRGEDETQSHAVTAAAPDARMREAGSQGRKTQPARANQKRAVHLNQSAQTLWQKLSAKAELLGNGENRKQL